MSPAHPGHYHELLLAGGGGGGAVLVDGGPAGQLDDLRGLRLLLLLLDCGQLLGVEGDRGRRGGSGLVQQGLPVSRLDELRLSGIGGGLLQHDLSIGSLNRKNLELLQTSVRSIGHLDGLLLMLMLRRHIHIGGLDLGWGRRCLLLLMRTTATAGTGSNGLNQDLLAGARLNELVMAPRGTLEHLEQQTSSQ